MYCQTNKLWVHDRDRNPIVITDPRETRPELLDLILYDDLVVVTLDQPLLPCLVRQTEGPLEGHPVLGVLVLDLIVPLLLVRHHEPSSNNCVEGWEASAGSHADVSEDEHLCEFAVTDDVATVHSGLFGAATHVLRGHETDAK